MHKSPKNYIMTECVSVDRMTRIYVANDTGIFVPTKAEFPQHYPITSQLAPTVVSTLIPPVCFP